VRSVNDPRATNVAQMVLSGTGSVRGGRPYMPAFARAYSNREIADVSNYVTARFGAKRSQLSAADVARLRTAN
jgi:mono/diheme cytochrome c family protein